MSPKVTEGRISATMADREPNFSPLDSRFWGTKTVHYILLQIMAPTPKLGELGWHVPKSHKLVNILKMRGLIMFVFHI